MAMPLTQLGGPTPALSSLTPPTPDPSVPCGLSASWWGVGVPTSVFSLPRTLQSVLKVLPPHAGHVGGRRHIPCPGPYPECLMGAGGDPDSGPEEGTAEDRLGGALPGW